MRTDPDPNMTNRMPEKKRILVVLTVMILAGIVVTLCLMMTGPRSRLSDNEIAALRDQYPVCGVDVPQQIDILRKLTMEDALQISDTFVYGKVAGECRWFSSSISTGSIELDKKGEANGISSETLFFEYPVEILEDTAGIYQKGDVIYIKANQLFQNFNPRLQEGMRIIVPVAQGKKTEGHVDYSVSGMYYVTDQGYVLSAYDEETLSSLPLNGLPVQKALEKIKSAVLQ